MGLTKSLEACGFFDADVWFRGVADLLIIDDKSTYIVLLNDVIEHINEHNEFIHSNNFIYS
jgi:hypothetical protein